MQPLVRELPFGGVGNSGMGKYHGEWGFRAYTNARGVLHHSTLLDPGVRYPPYSENERLRGLISRLSPLRRRRLPLSACGERSDRASDPGEGAASRFERQRRKL